MLSRARWGFRGGGDGGGGGSSSVSNCIDFSRDLFVLIVSYGLVFSYFFITLHFFLLLLLGLIVVIVTLSPLCCLCYCICFSICSRLYFWNSFCFVFCRSAAVRSRSTLRIASGFAGAPCSPVRAAAGDGAHPTGLTHSNAFFLVGAFEDVLFFVIHVFSLLHLLSSILPFFRSC